MHERWILHVDMDAFFAAVEVLDDPRLAGKPVIVGGTVDGHGVVSTASYEARKFGVHSAMPAAQAVKLCPQGIFMRPRPERYRELSDRVFELFREASPLVEPLSIDEAFLDVTGCAPRRQPPRPPAYGAREAMALAHELRAGVEEVTGGLTCSVGVAENKFLAKVASDLEKPNRCVLVPRGRAREFLGPLAVEKLWGVGPKTAGTLHRLGLHRVRQVADQPVADLERWLGTDTGRHLHNLAHGRDERAVHTAPHARSISQETTFAQFLPATRPELAVDVLFSLAHQVARRLRSAGYWGRTVNLKVRDERFTTWTRARTVNTPIQTLEEIFSVVQDLFRSRIHLQGRSVRLLGVGVSGLTRTPVRQVDLFDDSRHSVDRAHKIAGVEQQIRERLGMRSITRGRLLRSKRPELDA